MLAQPALECPHRGGRRRRVPLGQRHSDAPAPPTGVQTAQVEGGLKQWRGHEPVWPAGVITWQERGVVAIGSCLERALSQISDGARGQPELAGNVGIAGSEPNHTIQGQSESQFSGTRHGNPLLSALLHNQPGPTLPGATLPRNYASLFRTEHRVA
jgi:hypothetical protein